MTGRATYLLQSDLALLEAWGFDLDAMFTNMLGGAPYLVGSALERADYRDVDVRTIAGDDAYDTFVATGIDLSFLHLSVSLWGRKVTGLPIDWQLQRMTEANDEFDGRRHPLTRRRLALMEARARLITEQIVEAVRNDDVTRRGVER